MGSPPFLEMHSFGVSAKNGAPSSFRCNAHHVNIFVSCFICRNLGTP